MTEKKLWGPAVGWRGSLKETIQGLDLSILQTTLGPEAEFKIPKITPEDGSFLKNDRFLKRIIIHASHRVNLASQGNHARGILQSTLTKISQALEFNEKLKLGVVAHIGRGAGANMERVIEQTLSLNIPEGVTLYMENAASQGHEIGKNLQELEELFEPLPHKIKLCIDTQHSFAAGICTWQTTEDTEDFVRKIDEAMPYRLRLFHLNDSKTEFGSHVDRHEKIGAGKIWGEDKTGLLSLLDISSHNKIPMILETPDSLSDLDQLHKFWEKNK